MENFLTFLSNNYIYFLIAAGILLFALIGFLFDLKKSKDVVKNDEVIPDVTSNPSVSSMPQVDDGLTLSDSVSHVNDNVLSTPVEETYNPAPPMPEEPVINENPAPVTDQVQVNAVSSQQAETPNIPFQEEPVNVSDDQMTPQSQETVEEFK